MTNKNILLTRPLIDSAPLADTIAKKGYTPLVEPMLEIEYLPNLERKFSSTLSSKKIIVATSINALRGINHISKLKELPLIVMGGASKEKAYQLGFKNVTEAKNSAKSIINLISNSYDKAKYEIIFASGEEITIDIAEALGDAGFDASRIIVYKTIPSTKLSDRLLEIIKRNNLYAAMFFSTKTAEIFLTLIDGYAINSDFSKTYLITISKNVSQVFSDMTWKNKFVADNPSSDELIRILEATHD
jgi:uroporphyrinogen-III synthase